MFHHLGRETMIAPMAWGPDGWPVINGGNLIKPVMKIQSRLKPHPLPTPDVCDHFDDPTLAISWSFLRNPYVDNYILTRRPGYLGLTGGKDSLNDVGSPTFIGRRQQHFDVRAQTVLDYVPGEQDRAGLTVYHTNEHHYDLMVTRRNGKRAAVLRKHVGDLETESDPVFLPDEGNILLRVDATKLNYSFYAGTDEQALCLVGEGRTQFLSTECMVFTFTGCFIGLFAEGSGTAWFDYFLYDPAASGCSK
jgi:alpha-N-arabinofuranosidase